MSSPDGRNRAFVLDTNVLLYDPNSLNVFKEHDVYIPITVIEEVDTFKKELSETGRNARTVSRQLDALRVNGRLSEGVETMGGGNLRVCLAPDGDGLPRAFGKSTNDNLILTTVKHLHATVDDEIIFVTRDTNMRIKADALGVRAEDYENAHIDFDGEQYRGVSERAVSGEVIDAIYAKGSVAWEEGDLHANEFVMLSNEAAPSQTAMARYDKKNGRIKLVGRYKEGIWGIFARNKEQLFALDLLLDDSVNLVTIDGVAGTGKTLLAIACGLRKTADERQFRRLVVSRPIFPLGRDIGYLPGDLNDKLNPWMKPIFDNLELLLGSQDEEQGRNARAPSYQPLLDQGIIEVEPLTYIRGRSMPKQYFIVDEAQNLTPHEVKTVITRAGEGTKVILTGDPNQIDNPYVDATSNGLTYVVERFKDSAIAGHVTLRKGERSELAEQAAELL
ncbi:MAG: PhoH family protein [Proteobacteria bacterium]|nr:PhoH family protein [Pseudomonadota bacterium]MCP4920143.1 PhoH family protein [Pseudomonadota bacterium]